MCDGLGRGGGGWTGGGREGGRSWCWSLRGRTLRGVCRLPVAPGLRQSPHLPFPLVQGVWQLNLLGAERCPASQIQGSRESSFGLTNLAEIPERIRQGALVMESFGNYRRLLVGRLRFCQMTFLIGGSSSTQLPIRSAAAQQDQRKVVRACEIAQLRPCIAVKPVGIHLAAFMNRDRCRVRQCLGCEQPIAHLLRQLRGLGKCRQRVI